MSEQHAVDDGLWWWVSERWVAVPILRSPGRNEPPLAVVAQLAGRPAERGFQASMASDNLDVEWMASSLDFTGVQPLALVPPGRGSTQYSERFLSKL